MSDELKRKKMNSRWRKGAQRYSSERTVESSAGDGEGRRSSSRLTEARWVEAQHEQPGWRNGARIRKRV